ncbi:transcriptional regulator [Rhizobium sullae]|uniref:Transcriptional regulator n=1 Tax=Rhizobium sullae TaxID=50338 RepID=A0ABY5XZ73_RHISU|nr:transcriptional regulator [Rhizobium sullae]UWU19163.1 transcriptional regulator [Rhizobium sullae]
MKKVQRSFAVEYRSGRRKLNSNPNSIWGDVDLKSVAQDLQDEAMPFLPETSQVGSTGMSFAGEQQAAALLTPPIEQETNASALQETIMADDNNTMTDAETPAVAAPAPKKERKPRARKAAPETASAAVSAQPAAASNAAAGKPKRGRKAKSDEGVTSVKRAPKAVQAATAPSVAAVDEFADLLQLEEENQRLRKLLAEKLRAENADLRKRLNLG